jgi:hypothetical protein
MAPADIGDGIADQQPWPQVGLASFGKSYDFCGHVKLRSATDFRHGEAKWRTIQADLNVGQAATRAAYELTKLESAAVIDFPSYRSRRTQRRFHELKMIEKIFISRTVPMSALTTTD